MAVVKKVVAARRTASIVPVTPTVLAVTIALLISCTAAALDRSLIWGTYRPQVYFGIRAAEPESFLSGLVWFAPHRPDSFTKARHECDEADRIQGYGWTYHDGRSMAVQRIQDKENNYVLETSWLKTDDKGTGSWAVRIQGTVMDDRRPASLSTVFYAGLEAASATWKPLFEQEKHIEGLPSRGVDHDDQLEAGRFFGADKASATLPGFSLRFKDSPGAANRPARPQTVEHIQHEGEFLHVRSYWHYLGLQVPQDVLWRGKEVIQADLSSSVKKAFEAYGAESLPHAADLLTLTDSVQPSSNFLAVQRTFSGNFSIDLFYDANDSPQSALLDGNSFTVALEASKQAYDGRFNDAVPLSSKESNERKAFARELTSQIVGSVGYYHGSSIVDRSFTYDYDDLTAEPQGADPQLTPAAELLAATPSRSKFPRGFYWDEGFHLAHIGAWDPNLSLEILRSWLNLIDEDGWVAREQILGAEARSRVPAEFQTQYPTYANPPTLAMIVTDYIDRLKVRHGEIFPLEAEVGGEGSQVVFDNEAHVVASSSYLDDPVLARQFLNGIYPKLRRHYLWFRNTQRGQIKEWDRKARARGEAFRWRGRTKDHVLTSGLDDYPRAKEAHVGELHLDLMCWMGSFAEAMGKVARALGEDDDAEEYEKSYSGIVANLDDLHWDEEEQMYCDASVNDDGESFHVCHRGYLSLFPLTSQLLPVDSPHLPSILNLMRDPNHLWSPYGLRSLSKQDSHYGQGENYWRGPIWIPMNYLTLRALKGVSGRQNAVEAAG